MFLCTMPATWLWHPMYAVPACVLRSAIMCWTVPAAFLYSLPGVLSVVVDPHLHWSCTECLKCLLLCYHDWCFCPVFQSSLLQPLVWCLDISLFFYLMVGRVMLGLGSSSSGASSWFLAGSYLFHPGVALTLCICKEPSHLDISGIFSSFGQLIRTAVWWLSVHTCWFLRPCFSYSADFWGPASLCVDIWLWLTS